MADVRVDEFSLRVLTGDEVEVEVTFTLTLTPTEERLEIPFTVAIFFVEQNFDRDDWRLSPNQGLILQDRPISEVLGEVAEEGFDSPVAGFRPAEGPFTTTTTQTVTEVLDRTALPGGVGVEEWYCLAFGVPEISSTLGFSSSIRLDLN